MTDSSSSTASGGQNVSNVAQPNPKKQNPVRLLILLLLLLLVAAAYGYDRKIAGPACEEGQKIVLELLQQQQAQPGKVTASFAEVQKALGKQPSSRVDEKYYTLETYSWRRGSLFQTYYIRVIYRKDDKDGTFSVDGVTSPNEEPTETQLPGPIKPRVLTDEERAAIKPPPSPPSGPLSGPGAAGVPYPPPGKPDAGSSDESEPKPETPVLNPAEKPASPAAEKADSPPAEAAPAKSEP